MYVNARAGWRVFVIAASVAFCVGVGIRWASSPERMRQWVSEKLENASLGFKLKFRAAELRLSHGSLPALALLLSDVEIFTSESCRDSAPLTIKQLYIPLRWRSLVLGRLKIATVVAEGMDLDVDAIKNNCLVNSAQPTAEPPQRVVSKTKASAAPPAPSDSLVVESSAPQSLKRTRSEDSSAEKDLQVTKWWQREDFSQVSRWITGIVLRDVNIRFERKLKHVEVDLLSVFLMPSSDSVRLHANLRIPSRVTYGEVLPPLSISGIIGASSAELDVKAGVSEGSLSGVALLRPLAGGELQIEAEARLSDVPLSTMTPLLSKAGITHDRFKPKFLWLDCEAFIKGRFKNLIRENPLHLSNCGVEGEGVSIVADRVVREPSGRLRPFSLQISAVDVRRLLETLGKSGPEGVASDFGKITGVLDVASPNSMKLDAVWSDLQLRFSHRDVRALQPVSRVKVLGHLEEGLLRGSLDEIVLGQGVISGSMKFETNPEFDSGWVRANVKRLKFATAVEQVLIGGEVDSIAAQLEAKWSKDQLLGLDGQVVLTGFRGADVRTNRAEFKAQLKNDGIRLDVDVPTLEIFRKSLLVTHTRPLFFGLSFPDEWILMSDFKVEARVAMDRHLHWRHLKGVLEDGKIRLRSLGSWDPSANWEGWVELDFPSAKNLRWEMRGSGSAPVFVESESQSKKLSGARPITAAILGLPETYQLSAESKGGALDQLESVASRTQQEIRAMGQKVIDRAREIVPGVSSEDSLDEQKRPKK